MQYITLCTHLFPPIHNPQRCYHFLHHLFCHNTLYCHRSAFTAVASIYQLSRQQRIQFGTSCPLCCAFVLINVSLSVQVARHSLAAASAVVARLQLLPHHCS